MSSASSQLTRLGKNYLLGNSWFISRQFSVRKTLVPRFPIVDLIIQMLLSNPVVSNFCILSYYIFTEPWRHRWYFFLLRINRFSDCHPVFLMGTQLCPDATGP
jgi:hypothetical protein